MRKKNKEVYKETYVGINSYYDLGWSETWELQISRLTTRCWLHGPFFCQSHNSEVAGKNG